MQTPNGIRRRHGVDFTLQGEGWRSDLISESNLFIDKLHIVKLINLLSQTCPSNIGPETQCFNNERFGCYCLVGVDVSHISSTILFQ